MVFPIGSLTGRLVTLEHLGRDDRLGLQVGDLVEVMNDDYALRGSAGTLLEVEDRHRQPAGDLERGAGSRVRRGHD